MTTTTPADIVKPDLLNLPHEHFATRIWAQSSYAYPNIERLFTEIRSLRARLERAEAANAKLARLTSSAYARLDEYLDPRSPNYLSVGNVSAALNSLKCTLNISLTTPTPGAKA